MRKIVSKSDDFNFLEKEVAKLRKLSSREHGDKGIDKSRVRDHYQRDYARILYSPSFRRLGGKMQFLGLDPANFDRMRLTHSLEVAQIACSICTKLEEEEKSKTTSNKGKKADPIWTMPDLFAIQAICLAHDIGNPPFGHAGERVLDELAKDYGGFEGNAQTFRVLTRLERKYPDCEGLNLTHRTLLGVVKYFQQRTLTNKKFLYKEDYKLVKDLRKKRRIDADKTLDCAIMEIADDIANNAHDLEDVLHQKLINTEDIVYLLDKEKDNKSGIFKGYENVKGAISVFKEIRKNAIKHASKVCVIESHDEFETLLRKELISELVDRLVDDVDVVVQDDKKTVGLKSLKPLTKLNHLLLNAVKVEADIYNYEHIGERVIRGLYDVYADQKYNPKNVLLPHPYRNDKDTSKNSRLRGVIDYISGMTDQFAMEQYKRFYGHDVYEDGFYIKSKHKK